MEEVDPETALSAVESERKRRRERAVGALEWSRARAGLVPRSEAVPALADEYGWSEAQANRAVGDVVGDLVDPVQQVVHPERGKLVGIIEFHQYPDSGAYGYVDYDDVDGRRKRVVCSECVSQADSDAEVAHATEGEGTAPAEATWEALVTAVEDHYETEHDVKPSEVEVGASLASGTTISGSTAFHAGNDGIGSGLDADSLEGNEPRDLGSPNEPGWVEDANSPFEGFGQNVLTANLNTSASHIRVICDPTQNGHFDLQVNGSTSGYVTFFNDNTDLSGQSTWALGRADERPVFDIVGDGGGVKLHVLSGFKPNGTRGGTNNITAGPVSSVTLRTGFGGRDERIAVYRFGEL